MTTLTSETSLLAIKNVCHHFYIDQQPTPNSQSHQSNRDTIQILSNASLTLAQGQSIALTGPSGSGKSTLINLIAGTIPVQNGEILWHGTSLTTLDAQQRATWRLKNLGLVFQDFRLFNHLNALENAALPLELLGGSLNEARQEASQWLEQVGLSERMQHYPQQLSGGEQQRVALVRALIHKPKLILADEPTGNLDRNSAQHMAELLCNLTHSQECGLLIVTHDMELAQRTEKHLQIDQGHIQEVAQ